MKAKDYSENDYSKLIAPLIKENMSELFIDNFGGWSDIVSENKFFKVLENGFVKLFFDHDVFIGYVTYEIERDNSNSILINDIHIVKDYQGQGYGSSILEYVILHAKKLKINQLKIFVFKNNNAVKFYSSKGFKELLYLKKGNTFVMVKDI